MTDQALVPERETAVTEPEVQRPPRALTAPSSGTGVNVFMDLHNFETAQRMAKLLAHSSMVPDQYREQYSKTVNGQQTWVDNPDAMGNCVIALELAHRLRCSPLQIMQQVDMVKGRPGLRGAFVKALIDRSGLFTRLKYEWKGTPGTPEWGCRVYATEKSTGERLDGTWITWAMVVGEKWNANDKWKTMPEQMFMYRSAAFWGRAHAPELLMGMQTLEEIEDVLGPDTGPTPNEVRRLESPGTLQDRLNGDQGGEKTEGGNPMPARRRRKGAPHAAQEPAADLPSLAAVESTTVGGIAEPKAEPVAELVATENLVLE